MKQAWATLFKPWILERGREYYDEHRVTDLKFEDEQITAYVEGSEDYYVTILIDNNTPVELYCECPYAEGGEYCKHMAAVLFAVESTSSTGNKHFPSDDTTWKDAVDNLSAETLRTVNSYMNPSFVLFL